MILLDTSCTTDSFSMCGITRVVKSVYRSLKEKTPTHPICFDRLTNNWRELYSHENRRLSLPSNQKLITAIEVAKETKNIFYGALHKVGLHKPKPIQFKEKANGLITGDILHPKTFRAYPALKPFLNGPHVGIFHDLFALKIPQYIPNKTVAYFPEFLQYLSHLDGIAAISEESKEDLLNYWNFLGLKNTPPVVTIPLGTNLSVTKKTFTMEPFPSIVKDPLILYASTICARKNQINLLKAAKNLWDQGTRFRLVLAGRPRPESAGDAIKLAKGLKRQGYPVKMPGKISDTELEKLYSQCYFTVYPSHYEGFGLPVLESLFYGKPCVCTTAGALNSTSSGGGCLRLTSESVEAIQKGLSDLLDNHELYQKLEDEASSRKFRQWSDYTDDLLSFIHSLRK